MARKPGWSVRGEHQVTWVVRLASTILVAFSYVNWLIEQE